MPAKCGDELAEERSGPLRLTGSFPARVRATERPTFDGTVTVVNHSDRRVEGLAASRPDVYLLRSGRIVATPLPRDEVGLQLEKFFDSARPDELETFVSEGYAPALDRYWKRRHHATV